MRKTRRSKVLGIINPVATLSALALVGGWLLSCKGDGMSVDEAGDPIIVTPPGNASFFRDEIQPIFDANCVVCHVPGQIGYENTGGADQNGLHLSSIDSSYISLVGVPTFEMPEVAPNLRVDPGNPGNSYILQKLISDSPKEGDRMPIGGELSKLELQKIRSWIAAGAPLMGEVEVDTVTPLPWDSVIVFTEEQKQAILDILNRPNLTPSEVDSLKAIIASRPWENIDPEPVKKVPAEIWKIFDDVCSNCHWSEPSNEGIGCTLAGTEELDYADCLGVETPEVAYARLVNAPTFQMPGVAPLLRVKPGDTAGSYLWEKLKCDELDDKPKEGNCMPLQGDITDEEIEAIKQWILDGAPYE